MGIMTNTGDENIPGLIPGWERFWWEGGYLPYGRGFKYVGPGWFQYPPGSAVRICGND